MSPLRLKRTPAVFAGVPILPALFVSSIVSLFVSVTAGSSPASAAEVLDAYRTGTPIVGVRAVQRTTSDIMLQQSMAEEEPVLPPTFMNEHELDRSHLPLDPASPRIASVPAMPPDQLEYHPKVAGMRALSPQTVGVNFLAATLSGGSFNTNSFPPDNDGAVGPTQYVIAVNGRIATFSKTTGVFDGVLNASTNSFFTSVRNGSGTSDPMCRYDRLSGRWFITIINVSTPNRYLIAVSDSASNGIISASTVWSYYFFVPATIAPPISNGSTCLSDYPSLGVDANALYMGVSEFCGSGQPFQQTDVFVIRKASVLNGGPVVVTAFRALMSAGGGFVGPFSARGVDNYDPSSNEGYFMGVDGASFGKLWLNRVTDPGGSPSLSPNIQVTVPATSQALTVPHLGNTGGTNGNLDALDDRLFAVHIRNHQLWTAQNIKVDNTGTVNSTSGNNTRDAARWYQFNVPVGSGTPTIVQSGTVFTQTPNNLTTERHYFIPAVMVSGQGHVAMGFCAAGTNERVNAGTVGRLVGDPSGTMQTPVLITSSGTAYNPPSDDGSGRGARRWGDYSITALDPIDDMSMWTVEQYCSSTNVYGCRVSRLIAPGPAKPTSLPTITAGQPVVNVTLNGTSASGTGWYDPGADLPGVPAFSHLTVTITNGTATGTPPTVTSVAYLNPTTINLVLDASAATPSIGAQRYLLTVTNPDGQTLGANMVRVVAPNFTITASAGPNGSIAPSGAVSVPGGTNQSFTITPNACFDVADVLVDGGSVGATTSYTFVNVNANHTIAASFTPAGTRTITATAAPATHISPSGSVIVNCASDQTFTITADPCCSIADVVVDGVSRGALGSYTFLAVTADHTIEVFADSARNVLLGIDLLQTLPDQTFDDLAALAAFCPGWEVVGSSVIPLRGVPLDSLAVCAGLDVGRTDLAIRRTTSTQGLIIGASDAVPIEIVGLHLQSVTPFTVRDLNTLELRQWTLDLTLPGTPQTLGQMTIVRDNATGGHFDSSLPVRPLITLTDVTGGIACIHCQGVSPQTIDFSATNVPWRYMESGDFQLGGCTSNFVPTGAFLETAPSAQLHARPAPPAQVRSLDQRLAIHFDFSLVNVGPQPIDHLVFTEPRRVAMAPPGAGAESLLVESAGIDDAAPLCAMSPSPRQARVDWNPLSATYRRRVEWSFPAVAAGDTAPPMDLVLGRPACANPDSGAWYEVEFHTLLGCARADTGTFRFHAPPVPPCPPGVPCEPRKLVVVTGGPGGPRVLSAGGWRRSLANPRGTNSPEVLHGIDLLKTAPRVLNLNSLAALCPDWVVVGNPEPPLRGIPLDSIAACPGGELGSADAAVERLQDTQGLAVGQPAAVSARFVGLHLQSVQPFLVRNTSTSEIRSWMLDITLPPTWRQAQPTGQVVITQDDAQGGHFQSTLSAIPLLRFTDVTPGEPTCVRCEKVSPEPIVIYADNVPWHYPLPGDFQVAGCTSNFVAGTAAPPPSLHQDDRQWAIHFDFSVANAGLVQSVDRLRLATPRYVPMSAPGAVGESVGFAGTSLRDSTPLQCPLPAPTMFTTIDRTPGPGERQTAWWFFPPVPPGDTAPPMDVAVSLPACADPDSGAWFEVSYWLSQGCTDVDSGTVRFRYPPASPCPPGGNCPGVLDVGGSPFVAGAHGLEQNVPNPFAAGSATRIRFELARAERVQLRVYDPQGRLVRKLSDGHVTAGVHEVAWNGLDDSGLKVKAGVYFYRLDVAGDPRRVRKLVILE